jgi:hypothetical protein
MRDLRADRQIVAVEPDVRTDSETDPALKKWHECEHATPDQMETTDPNAYFTHLEFLGGPPFRYYKIDIDGNPNNGKEDLIYHEKSRSGQSGSTGYDWVDLKGCFVKGGAPVTRSERTPKGFQQVDLVTKYRSEYVVLDMYTNSTDPNESRYRLRMYRLNRQKPFVCAWHEPVSK